MRQIVDDRYTARVLLGLSQTYKNNLGENFDVQTSATICQNGFAPRADNGVPTQNGCDATFVPLQGGSIDDENDADNADGTTMGADQNTTTKRVRRRGKYTPQEREKIRLVKVAHDHFYSAGDSTTAASLISPFIPSTLTGGSVIECMRRGHVTERRSF